jgi:hypothetical protein
MRCKHLEAVVVSRTLLDQVQWCRDCGAARINTGGVHAFGGGTTYTEVGRWKYPTYETMTERVNDVQRAYYGKALDTAVLPRTTNNDSFIARCNGTAQGLNKAYKVIRNLASVRSLKDD